MVNNFHNDPVLTGLESRYTLFGAQEGTRTPTTLRSPAPEAGASTNFATWACLYYRGMGVFRSFLDHFGFFSSDFMV